ncbi:MAG: MASE1 domain-containing protein, partial [Hyphomicrobiaceae bacterium]
MLRQPRERAQCGPALERGLRQERSPAWARALGQGMGLAMALACVYFLAARLSFALLSEAEAVPVLWPASGVAAGVLIALGRDARAAVAAGVLAATVAANLLEGRPVWVALCFGLCNAGEALLTAWLVDRWCGRPFKFDDWHGLWGFLAAAALASGTAAFGAAVAVHQLPAAAPLHEVWRVWAAADGLGIVIVAPLLVGLYRLAFEPMPRSEALEGAAALGLLAAASAALFAAPPGAPLSHVPPAALFPFLLWIAARCRPVLAAAAVLVVSAVLVWATTFRLGQLGGADLAVPTVQTMLLIGSLCTLTLSALFAERRRNEAALRESNERLRLALGGAELGVWSVDLATDAFESDERDGCINGHDPAGPPRTLTEVRRVVHPEDLSRLDAAFAIARQTGTPCRTEYRVLPRGCREAAPARWVAVEGNAVRDGAGRPVRLLGVTRDITERKRAEQALAER